MHERISFVVPLAAIAAVAAMGVGCVTPFSGSKVELLLYGGVQVPGDTPTGNGRPPSDTHYEIYVTSGDATFQLFQFEVVPVIDTNDPCFIEPSGSRFPGLQSSQIVDKTTQVAMADGTVTDAEAGLIATAQIRVGDMQSLAMSMKTVVSHEVGLTAAVVASAEAGIPDKSMIDDASNAARLKACNALFAAHPGHYVGTDLTIAIPLNGSYYGMVQGTDPRDNAPVGGGQITVNAGLDSFDAMRINWNFNDPNEPRKANYSPSNIGWNYMAGTPVMRERDVINVAMANDDFTPIAGEAAIFTDLNEDNVHF